MKKLAVVFALLLAFPLAGEALILSPGHSARETGVPLSAWTPPLPPTTARGPVVPPPPKWLQQYPSDGGADSEEYLRQERRIARNETLRAKEYEITRASRIPDNPRSQAILAHLRSLSRSLDAAAARARSSQPGARPGTVLAPPEGGARPARGPREKGNRLVGIPQTPSWRRGTP